MSPRSPLEGLVQVTLLSDTNPRWNSYPRPADFKGGLESRCFRVLEDLGFEVVLKNGDAEEAAAQGSGWTDAELEAAVLAYYQMLGWQEAGEAYSKTDVRQLLLAGALENRSKGSIEYRMGNISATLAELCLPTVQGYLAQQNVGEGVKARIREILSRRGLVDAEAYEVTSDEVELEARVAKLLTKPLKGRPGGRKEPRRLAGERTTFDRDQLVKAWVLQEARGSCELCHEPAPFSLPNGTPFLEVHHVVRLADSGPDVPENAVALCPNCHRRCHYAAGRDEAIDSLYETVERLERA